jgi:hypothetical protein
MKLLQFFKWFWQDLKNPNVKFKKWRFDSSEDYLATRP